MAGIAGIYTVEGEQLRPEAIESMVAAQQHRGPDGISVWRDGAIGLAQLQMHTTPEAVEEKQPLVSGDGMLTLVADARIDNRDELIAKLSSLRRGNRVITDAELILHSYKRWGVSCVNHLIGAFAFALWDAREEHLFCARDPVGVRPFSYNWDGQSFVFASEVNAVLAHPEVTGTINEVRVADFLAHIHLCDEYTFYNEVLRLPAGHFALINKAGFEKHSYWQWELPEQLNLDSKEAYYERFRSIFEEAVRCRLRSYRPPASFLSGGLDSSGVTAMAQTLSGESLHTFSVVFDKTPETDERFYIDAVLENAHHPAHFLDGHDHDPIHDLLLISSRMGKPSIGLGPSILWMLYGSVADEGLNIVLDGHGGDEVLSKGHGYVRELAAKRRWWALLREIRNITKDEGGSWVKYLLLYWLQFSKVPERIARRVRRLIRSVGSTSDVEMRPNELTSAALTSRTNALDRKRESRKQMHGAPTERRQHLQILSHSLQVEALEEVNQIGHLCGVEPRFPYWDVRLVQFCLSLPTEVKYEHGVGRQILRNSLRSTLPDEIADRRDKAVFNRPVAQALADSRYDVLKIVEELMPLISDYMDVEKVRTVTTNFFHDQNPNAGRDFVSVMEVLRLGLWLQET